MGLATKLLRHHRRLLLRPLSSPYPLFAPPEYHSHTPSLLCSDHSSITFNPGRRPDNSFRSFSWFAWNPASDNGRDGGGETREDGNFGSSESGSEFSPLGGSPTGVEPSIMGLDGPGMVEEVAGESVWSYPMRAVISLLDGFHDFSGLPWWVIISTSTLALRLSLLPMLIVQLRKAQEIALFFPKLPPPFPPPLSGRSFREQYKLFQKKRRELGCPTYLWNFAFFTVQVPCFLLWMTSIRRMCLDNHPGFDTGGMLWFQNLTDFPSGTLGFVFPILISGLHYVNVQISFRTIRSRNLRGILGLLTKYYKVYLDIMAIPLLFIGFHIPQGSLVYWVTNSSLTLFQLLALKNSFIRMKLGLRDEKVPLREQVSSEKVLPENNIHLTEISVDTLSPQKLLDIALEDLAAGRRNEAIPLLEMAIEKDPELVRALIAKGQILCSQGSLVEAAKYFENAISKIQDEEDPFLLIATFGAGVSHLWQGNKLEGIKHLKRIAELKEPESPANKSCYHQGLVILGSTLFEEGKKSEAAKYLRIAATYDPGVSVYLKECEEAG
ncbi:ALBINO3-like protein 2, chloroplastic [Musa acuminata AAA Group]|uniref:ALBINO3-like protein 2, chloroplastic n=1 Tax=Musa acuminata AAA Group TaxID=214697 RepID=UPI0031CF8A53